MQYIVTIGRKREILFNFWLTEKLQKRWNWFFSPEKERKKEKLELEKSLIKTNDEQEIKGYRVQVFAASLKKKNQTLRNGTFFLILELCKSW